MASEPFPLLNTSADQLHNTDVSAPRRRRASSALSGGIRAGDTGAPAFATSRASIIANDSKHQVSLPKPGGDTCGGQTHSPCRFELHRLTIEPLLQISHLDGNGTAAGSGSHKRLSKRRRARGLLSRVRQTMVKHTYALPGCILAFFLTGYAFNPTESNPLHQFILLSYPLLQLDPSKPIQYGKGAQDFAFVAFYTVVISFLRELLMLEVLRPLARLSGLSKSKQARFMEQMYMAVYFAILGPLGMYVMSRTPVWYFNTRGMYEGYPHRTHEAVVKFYYLFQAAFWLQQAIVLTLGLEKPRKDYKELVAHHVVSLALIWLSYRFHFTYMGIAVYITHDISDFFLATSKILSYLDHPLVAPYFAIFAGIWIYLRHVINIKIIWSCFTEFRTVGPFVLNFATEQYKGWISQIITSTLLILLQSLNLFWLFFILRIGYRVAFHNSRTDDRSDDEDEEEEEEDVQPAPALTKEKDASKQIKSGIAKNGVAIGSKKLAENGSGKR